MFVTRRSLSWIRLSSPASGFSFGRSFCRLFASTWVCLALGSPVVFLLVSLQNHNEGLFTKKRTHPLAPFRQLSKLVRALLSHRSLLYANWPYTQGTDNMLISHDLENRPRINHLKKIENVHTCPHLSVRFYTHSNIGCATGL